VVTRALGAYREAHSTPELDADRPLHHENYDDHFAVTWPSRGVPIPDTIEDGGQIGNRGHPRRNRWASRSTIII
jgi:hypothetical protein